MTLSTPKFSTNIYSWLDEIRKGNLDTVKLRKIWPIFVKETPDPYVYIWETYNVSLVECSYCKKPAFTGTTKTAYSGAHNVCSECFKNYSMCESCKSYILTQDLGNPTHIHLLPSRNANMFEGDAEVEVWNADVMMLKEKQHFLTTSQEKEVWKHQKECHLQVMYPPHREASFRFFGIELEVEKIPGAPPDMVKRTKKLLDQYAIVKHDGSLSKKGKGGFEIVTVPATLKYHESGPWDSFFKYLGNYFEQAPPSTGLHVHVGLGTINKITVGKMLVFINSEKNREFIESIAERTLNVASPTNGKVYAKLNPGLKISSLMTLKQHLPNCPWHQNNKKVNTMYVIDHLTGHVKNDTAGHPIIATINPGQIIIRPTCKCPEGKYNIDKYEAFRLSTQRPTVEVRIFRGVVVKEFIYAALEFVDALIDYCDETSPVNLGYEKFLAWICRYNDSGRSKLYPNLSRLLIQKNWIDPKKVNPRLEVGAAAPR